MLSDEQAAVLIKYLKGVQLSKDQEERLINKYWDANGVERKEIARGYAHLFSRKDFIDRLLHQMEQRQRQQAQTQGQPLVRSSADMETGPQAESKGSVASTASSPTSGRHHSGSSRRVHSQMLLRTAIEDQFPKLVGRGPFPIGFDLVKEEPARKEVVDLFASQFTHPDRPEIYRLVSLPQACNARTRSQTSGGYTWFIRSLTTGEVTCAVTVIAHHSHTRHFVEVPLFATAAGYKRCGFGRLLDAALAAWCAEAHFEFIMISADMKAVPFWQHLRYSTLSSTQRKSIDFYYQHECYQFKGATAMIAYCTVEARRTFQNLLQSMKQLVVQGHMGLAIE